MTARRVFVTVFALLALVFALYLLSLFATAPNAEASKVRYWNIARVTAYSAEREWLTGCYARGRCVMACGGELDDDAFTVAANPRHGLRCGQRIEYLKWDRDRRRMLRARARVTDRTASYFDFEFTPSLAGATGAFGASWDAPRYISWRLLP